MNDMLGNDKENEVTPESTSGEVKKTSDLNEKKMPDLNDTISRLLRRKADADAQESADSED